MKDIVVQETLEDIDKDGDGKVGEQISLNFESDLFCVQHDICLGEHGGVHRRHVQGRGWRGRWR